MAKCPLRLNSPYFLFLSFLIGAVCLSAFAQDSGEPSHVVVVSAVDIREGAPIREDMVAEIKMRGAGNGRSRMLICSRYAVGRTAQVDMPQSSIMSCESVGISPEDMKVFPRQHNYCPKLSCMRAKTLINYQAPIRASDVDIFSVSMDDIQPEWVTRDRLVDGLKACNYIKPGEMLTTQNTR